MGNINAPMMSNNQVNITNNYWSLANLDCSNFTVLRVGDIYLEEEFKRYTFVDHVGWTRYRGHITTCSNLSMSIWTYRGEKAAEALEKTYKKYASLPRHPNILQLYGVCCSPHLTALVFHGAPYFMNRKDYYKSLPSSQWMTHYLKLHQQNESAHSMLEAHNLRGWPLRISDVDERGKLVIADFFPTSKDDPPFDPRICMAFETNTFIKEDLLDYYKFLYDMRFPSFYAHTTVLPSPFEQTAPFQLSHPEINFPVYSTPGWNKVVNGMDITVGQTGIVLTLLPNMTIRCCILTPQIPTLSIFETIRRYEQDNEALFATWACQANHLICDLPINIMDLQTELSVNWGYFKCHAQSIPDWKRDTESPRLNNLLETEHLYLFGPLKGAGNIYWSQDEEGQHIIEDPLIQAAFGITIDWHCETLVHSILPQCYQILCTIHEVCGFDPYSTQVADYLGLPLAVINNGYSRLEECMEDPEESELRDSDYVLRDFNSDVEDPEYDPKSESGDSDYVSASEDV
ncbi:hypothetical protein C8J56DRAFT_1081939 [Mycena floridula]|nr:hypothetical protein C8J56DRAFT_1081939 [Mycena floridula]